MKTSLRATQAIVFGTLVISLHVAAIYPLITQSPSPKPPTSQPKPMMVSLVTPAPVIQEAIATPQPVAKVTPPPPEPVVQPKPEPVVTPPPTPKPVVKPRPKPKPVVKPKPKPKTVAKVQPKPKPVVKPQPKPVQKPQPAPAPKPVQQIAQAASAQPTPRTQTVAQRRAAPAPVRATAPIFNAAYLNNPAPAYPRISKRRGEEGVTMLMVNVSSAGRASSVSLHRTSGSKRLDEAAIKAVRKWRFVPAKRGNIAVAGSVIVPVKFQLR